MAKRERVPGDKIGVLVYGGEADSFERPEVFASVGGNSEGLVAVKWERDEQEYWWRTEEGNYGGEAPVSSQGGLA